MSPNLTLFRPRLGQDSIGLAYDPVPILLTPLANLTRWEPSTRAMSLREAMDRLFEDSFVGLSQWPSMQGDGNLAIDLVETNDEVVVKAAVPGLDPEDIDISVQGDMLTIRGESKEEQEFKEGNYLRRERRWGSFSRSVQLPVTVQADRADAQVENGVLTLYLPKSEEVKPRTIRVKAGKGNNR